MIGCPTIIDIVAVVKSSFLLVCLAASLLRAATYPTPVGADWVVHDFRFHTGETLRDLRLHYTTVGANSGEPVLILHGTNGTGTGFLRDSFAGELFGPGQPLDARTHYIILPDAIGSGDSSKPSDGLRMRFPRYNYDDMVRAQYRLVSEHLGIRHLRAVLGISMGGMHTWMWGEVYPGFMDALMPMAALPVEVAGRNWMLRRMVIDMIRSDPEWKDGNYEKEPSGLQRARVYFGVATNGGTQAIYDSWPTREKADAEFDRRLAQPPAGDANDVLYEFEASRDYNPEPGLEKIQARLIALNSADDERNPAELGIMEREIKRVTNGRYVLIPAGPDSRGHGTTAIAKLWKAWLEELLADRK